MRDCSTMDDLGVGAKEGGEEIELSLGLSIGGNSRKSQKTANADLDLGQENRNCSELTEQQRKREVQALMRQEARRKRDEKLRKRGLVTGLCEDNVGAEAQRVEIRARERERRENEAKVEGRECGKREKNEERGHNGAENVSQGAVPVVPYPPLQFVPLGNGFVYPCVVPCLGTPGSSGGGREENDGGVLRPVACRGFWPGQGGLRPGDLVMGGSDFECKRGKDGGNWRAAANGSPVRGSPEASEIQSSSQQGGSSSSDTGSHSSQCKPESPLKYAFENGVPSCQKETTQTNCETTKNTNRAAPFRAIKSSPTKLTDQTDSKTQSNPEDKPQTSQNPNPGSVKVASDQGLDAPSLSQMPCVSTTGNGPNGKTITGFLYRYTKTEVSIVCVCHGSSFSPAEFVEHAGGEDITHPLRHITVVPSAF